MANERHSTHDALELAAALESQGRALIAHAARLRELAGEGGVNGEDSAADVWLDAAAVVQRTGLALSTVYRLARRGDLGAVRCGRAFRFSKRRLAQYGEKGGVG